MALCAALATMLIPLTASADSRCTVTLRSTLESAAWRGAVTSAERAIAKHPPEDDCREVVVDADERGADVTFTTRDQRTATRRIARPADLRPVIEALLVTVPDVSGPPTAPIADAPVPAIAAASDADRPDPELTPPPMDRASTKVDAHAGPIVALGAGITLGSGEPGTIGQAEAGYLTHGWELALVGRLEPTHDAPRTSTRAELSATGVQLLAARRASMGSVTWIFGATAGVFAVSEAVRRDSTPVGADRHEDTLVDTRFGAMFGCLAPRIGPIRLRGQVDAQLGLFEQTPKYADLPANPRFTLAFTLGVETNLLP